MPKKETITISMSGTDPKVDKDKVEVEREDTVEWQPHADERFWMVLLKCKPGDSPFKNQQTVFKGIGKNDPKGGQIRNDAPLKEYTYWVVYQSGKNGPIHATDPKIVIKEPRQLGGGGQPGARPGPGT